MRTHKVLGLGLVSSLICGSAATAGDFTFQGLDYRIAETNAVSGDFNWTVEIYVLLNDDERLDAVAGDGINDKRLATSGVFYQNPFGGPTSADVNPLLYGSFPSLQYDSWVTVGAMDSTGYPYDNNAILDIGIDWTNFEDNGGDVYSDNGLWFITPEDSQGTPMLFTNQNCEEKLGTLVARVTVFGENENVYLGALFQGKDNLNETWQATDEITIEYTAITDCNENGVDDACDIANGSSADDNGNGIPDECEFPDCNGNGVDDSIDIANGDSEDCNSNGIPDECEMADGDCNDNGILDECEMFDDCNDNGIPDECEKFSDCNDNDIPDECEDLTDWDGNGVADICEGLVAYNATQSVGYTHIDDAIAASDDGDTVWVQADHVNAMNDLEYHNAAIDIYVMGGDADGFSTNMTNGARLHGGDVAALDSVRSGTDGTASVGANSSLSSNFAMVYRNASLDFEAPTVSLGDVLMRMDSELGINGAGTVGGLMTCAEGSAIYADLSITGELIGTVDIYGNTSNAGEMRATDDILIGSNLTNDGLIAIHRGVLYVLGDLTNNGTIIGEVDSGPGMRGGDEPEVGDGMRVVGNYNAGADASLFMQHENWRLAVGGNFNVAINDNARFDMSQATLALTNSGAKSQQIEVMSTDMGGIEEALDPAYPGAFPFDTLRIESGSRVVGLVDSNDNDGDQQEMQEVIYVRNLVVDAGATLNTNGYIIYTSEVDNQGTIIGEEDDIIIINPPVLGDLNGDGVVNVLDLLIVVAEWGPCTGSCDSDLNGDSDVNVLDLLIVIANWTP
jgi:hypothetical protein